MTKYVPAKIVLERMGKSLGPCPTVAKVEPSTPLPEHQIPEYEQAVMDRHSARVRKGYPNLWRSVK